MSAPTRRLFLFCLVAVPILWVTWQLVKANIDFSTWEATSLFS